MLNIFNIAKTIVLPLFYNIYISTSSNTSSGLNGHRSRAIPSSTTDNNNSNNNNNNNNNSNTVSSTNNRETTPSTTTGSTSHGRRSGSGSGSVLVS
ncbi:hypothetical protein Glove_303g71 [Diversispora epigaea]|uniref:Uncharacterized protein n=1 Tax=Diversispora epigaea TaxID=1348612 RepID=A0A397I160_9GLOM|nr:hypothetical protein Glove_303g71 [Diversispora epigaea]